MADDMVVDSVAAPAARGGAPPPPPTAAGGAGGAGGDGGVDTDLYSRQIYVMGMEGMSKLSRYSVLLVGLNGVGVEVSRL